MYVSTEVSECTLAFQAQIGRAVILDWGMWHLCYLCSAPVFIVFVGHMSTLIAGPELRSMLAVYGTMDFFKPQPRLKCQKTCIGVCLLDSMLVGGWKNGDREWPVSGYLRLHAVSVSADTPPEPIRTVISCEMAVWCQF